MNKAPNDISELEQRIRTMQKKTARAAKTRPTRLMLNTAFNVITEFVSPVIVGICLGYLLDYLFHTKPLLMIILSVLGCAAGVINLYKLGQQVERKIKG